jgi:hypothetical protein
MNKQPLNFIMGNGGATWVDESTVLYTVACTKAANLAPTRPLMHLKDQLFNKI